MRAFAGGLGNKIDWSPDGSRIAYDTRSFGPPKSSNIFTMRTDGTGVRQLTHATGGKVNDGLDSWSPDGKRIAFISNPSGTYQIYVTNADGTHATAVTNTAGGGHLAGGERTYDMSHARRRRPRSATSAVKRRGGRSELVVAGASLHASPEHELTTAFNPARARGGSSTRAQPRA